jgi:uncharacterized membrane protein
VKAPVMHFPRPFQHGHPPVLNVNVMEEERLTVAQRAADRLASVIGSWSFILIQSALLIVWATLNVVAWVRHWDPYPFILMNLMLSLQAAFAGPVIMMSQNRQSVRDRLEAHNDFLINQKAEEEIAAVLEHLAAQDRALAEIHRMLADVVDARNGKDAS